uniref:Uncharacterized protein n=1 Tax=viral metagenome TaxID=1070528 RepID=A0A6C0HQT1_9ZZZZ
MDFVLKTVYSFVYYYSCLEIWISEKLNENSIVKKIYDYIDSFYVSSTQYLFVENGYKIVISKDLTSVPQKYDFILRNEYVKKKKNYKIIYDSVKDIKEKYEISTKSFLSFVVTHKNIDIDIHLNTREYTYMVVGNCINKKFIYYLLKNMEFAKEPFTEFDYSLQILTNDVTFLNLTSSDKLVIMKYGFIKL